MTIEIPSLGLGKAQMCGRVKPVNWILAHPLFITGSPWPTAIHSSTIMNGKFKTVMVINSTNINIKWYICIYLHNGDPTPL